MKVLNLSIALSLLCSTQLLSQTVKGENFDSFISQNKKKQFTYEYEKIEAQSSAQRDSWIAPLRLNYSYSKSNPYDNEQTSQNANVKMDQTIFQFGGIYYGIKLVQATKIYSDYSVDSSKRSLAKNAISLLMQIKQINLRITKQELQIKNAEISLEQQKEKYLNGQLDSGFLDNAVIERNRVIQALYDMQTNKERLISKFQTISDIDYKEAVVPEFQLIDEERFLNNNIVLDISKSDIEKNRYNKNVTMAKYFPRVSFTAGYNWSKSENPSYAGQTINATLETNNYDYGLRVSIPIDINTFSDVEASKVDYLKSKLVLDDKKRELKALFEQVMQNIENFDKKSLLSKENVDIYSKLLADTKEQYKAGYKTTFDVELLDNSLKIQEMDSKIFEIDRQLELLTLYEMYKNEI